MVKLTRCNNSTLETIKISALIDFTLIDDFQFVDFELVKNEIQYWLEHFHIDKRKHSITGLGTFEYCSIPGPSSHLIAICSGIPIIDYRRFSSAIIEKAKYYAKLDILNNVPYIICIYTDFHAWVSVDVAFDMLCGDIGLFANDPFLNNVSGVLFARSDGEFFYIENPNNTTLDHVNREIFSKYKYF